MTGDLTTLLQSLKNEFPNQVALNPNVISGSEFREEAKAVRQMVLSLADYVRSRGDAVARENAAGNLGEACLRILVQDDIVAGLIKCRGVRYTKMMLETYQGKLRAADLDCSGA